MMDKLHNQLDQSEAGVELFGKRSNFWREICIAEHPMLAFCL